jgi:hypothetical protein
MATKEKSYEFIIYFLLIVVILNIVLFIASSLHWTNPDVSPQIIRAMLLGTLTVLAIFLGIFMVSNPTENNYLKLISAIVLILGLLMFFGIIQIRELFLLGTIIFSLIVCIIVGYIFMRLFGVLPSKQSTKKPSNPYIPPIYNPPKNPIPQPPRNPLPPRPKFRLDPSQSLQVNVENAIRTFQPRKRYQYEIDYQNELYNWLGRYFPVQYEVQTGSSRPDLIIKNIAIEIKGPTGNRELDTLTTKFLKYSNHYPYFIIVLFDCNFSDGHFNEISNGIRKFAPHVKIIKK